MNRLQSLRIGHTREAADLDFKKFYWSHGGKPADEWQFEMAKDIAAMANTWGGHLVVGAAEKQEVLAAFLDPALPSSWESELTRITASWLVPEPTCSAKLMDFDESTPKQLVIAIEPSIDTVLVRNPTDDRHRVFAPFRRESQTVFAPPRSNGPDVEPRAPSVADQISGTQTAGGPRRPPRRHRDRRLSKKLEKKGVSRSTVVADRVFAVNEVREHSILLGAHQGWLVLPYEYIEAIWEQTKKGSTWNVRVRGRVADHGDSKKNGHLTGVPPA